MSAFVFAAVTLFDLRKTGNAVIYGLLSDVCPKLNFCFESDAVRSKAIQIPYLLRHRYLGPMVLLNLSQNSLVGGGGRTAFIAEFCGFFPILGFL
jgi:hypothetical protein